MVKKITIITICLLVFTSVSFVDANELRQQRKRLENIEEMVNTMIEKTRLRGKDAIVSSLEEISAKIDNIHSRIKEKSDSVLEEALLGDGSARCYFADEYALFGGEEEEVYVKEGKVVVEEVVDGEYFKLLEIPKDGVMYIWEDEQVIEISSSTTKEEEEIMEEYEKVFYDCFCDDLEEDLFEVPEDTVTLDDVM